MSQEYGAGRAQHSIFRYTTPHNSSPFLQRPGEELLHLFFSQILMRATHLSTPKSPKDLCQVECQPCQSPQFVKAWGGDNEHPRSRQFHSLLLHILHYFYSIRIGLLTSAFLYDCIQLCANKGSLTLLHFSMNLLCKSFYSHRTTVSWLAFNFVETINFTYHLP